MDERVRRPHGRGLILQQYSLGYQSNPNLTPAEYMMLANPGDNEVRYRGKVYKTQYANADSAGRQFRKLRRGETSGERMERRALERPYLGRRVGGRANMWRVTFVYEYTDRNGERRQVYRSQTVRGQGAQRRTTYEGVRLAQSQEMQDLIDERSQTLIQGGSDLASREGKEDENALPSGEIEFVGTIIRPVSFIKPGTTVAEIGEDEDYEYE